VALAPIPNKAAYLLELSTTATVRETADTPPEITSLKRQAIQLVDSRVDGMQWRRTITEYWLESAATQRVRDALKDRPHEPSKPGAPPPPPPPAPKPGTIEALRAKPFHSLADLASVHMLEVRCAPIEVGLDLAMMVISGLNNADPGVEGTGREPKPSPIRADRVYAATVLPALVDEVREGKTAKGKMRVMVGAGTFDLEHDVAVVKREDALVLESTIGGPATSMTRNFITLTFTGEGRVTTWLAHDALPNRAEGTIGLKLRGKRAAPNETPQEAEILSQSIAFTLTRIPVSWDEERLITIAWMA